MSERIPQTSPSAIDLHLDALVWDMVWPWEPSVGNDVSDLHAYKASGHKVISATVAGDNHNISQAILRIAEFRSHVQARRDELILCNGMAQIERALNKGQLAVLMHLEGTRCFERSLEVVEVFSALGIRHALLAFNNANSAGGGCMDPSDSGLTPYGKRLIRRFEELGILLDLSHAGHRTASDAMALAMKPCTFSHSNVNRLWPHPRNLSDEEIKACAAMGGVIGISGSSMYHGAREQIAGAVFRHIDYIAQLVGTECVGFGIDAMRNTTAVAEFMQGRPEEWPDVLKSDWRGIETLQPEMLVDLTECMLKAGYPQASIREILGENFRRLCAAVWPKTSS